MLKRTCKPFHGKAASALEREGAMLMRMGNREAATKAFNEAEKLTEQRYQLHLANGGRNRKPFPHNLVNGRVQVKKHWVGTHPFRGQWSRWS